MATEKRTEAQIKKDEAALRAAEREEAILRLQHYVLDTRGILAKAMAKAKDELEPYARRLEVGKKLSPADRLDFEEFVFALRDATWAASQAFAPDAASKAADISLSEKARVHLENLSLGLALSAKLLGECTVERMVEADKAEPDVEWGAGESYLWSAWHAARVNLFRSFKYSFFITGEVKLVRMKLNRELSNVWVNDDMDDQDFNKVRDGLVKLVSESHEDPVEKSYEKKQLSLFVMTPDTAERVEIAKGIIHRTAHAKAVTRVSFVELIDSSGNIVGDYNPHANVEKYVGAMAQRRARRNPVPVDVKVLVDWIRWLE